MGLLRELEGAVNRALRHREIGASLAHYRALTGTDASAAETYSDAGSFRSQLGRLFSLSTPADFPDFEAVARSVVASCHTNRYYRAADQLSDVVDALEQTTWLRPGPNGEPPLAELSPELRHGKLAAVRDAWIVPRKVGSIETVVAAHARVLGRRLPYAALARFERAAARFFALLAESEVLEAEQRIGGLLTRWAAEDGVRARMATPADGVAEALEVLEGWVGDGEVDGVRTRLGWPVRLANVAAEDRAAFLALAWRRLGIDVPAAPVMVPVPAAAPPAPRRPRKLPPPPSAETDGTGALRLLLGCPKCGGDFTADDETVSVECDYCGSLLLLSAAERDEIYVDEDRFADGREVLEVVIQYRLTARRAELVGEWRTQQEEPDGTPSESWLRARLAPYERDLRAGARLLRAQRVFAPYWHMTGLVLQGSVGRRTHGPKLMRVRAWAVEHTVPAYGEAYDLRDRGLRLAHARVQPLTVEKVRELRSFLPWLPVPERTYREVEKWRQQDLEPGFEAVARYGDILHSGRVVAYRPYWLAEITLAGETSWTLADGVFRTLAGHPGPDEVANLLAGRIADPLRSGEPSFRRVGIIPSRCPDCGAEQDLDPHDHVSICANCHLALAPTEQGIRVQPCDHVMDEDAIAAEWLPFWRFSFELDLDGKLARDLPGLARAVFGDNAPPGWAPQGDVLWIPAFRLLGSEPGDEAFRRLVEAMHVRPQRVMAGKIPLGLPGTPRGASVSASEAEPLGRLATVALHGGPGAARLNTLLFTRTIAKPPLRLRDARLTMVPFEAEGRELALPRTPVRVPRLLLEGGPELEALRVSVHRLPRA